MTLRERERCFRLLWLHHKVRLGVPTLAHVPGIVVVVGGGGLACSTRGLGDEVGKGKPGDSCQANYDSSSDDAGLVPGRSVKLPSKVTWVEVGADAMKPSSVLLACPTPTVKTLMPLPLAAMAAGRTSSCDWPSVTTTMTRGTPEVSDLRPFAS
eukprot:Colp12_sorted_trinity150504_noHs@12759